MKKYIFLAAALTVMGCGMTSCSNNAEDVIEQNEQAPKVTKLVFTVAKDAQTRASWDGYTPVFDDGDEVSLFSENNNNVKLTAHVDGSTVTLVGEGISGDTDLYFVYPYCSTAEMTAGKITSTDTDSPYNYLLNGYGIVNGEIGVNKYPANALSLAKSEDGGATALSFKGLMAILKFTPLSDRTGSLSLGSGSSGIPCGQMTINVATSSIEYGSSDESRIWCPNSFKDYTFTTENSYYIAFPAHTPTYNEISFNFPDYTSTDFVWKNPATINYEAGKMYNLNK